MKLFSGNQLVLLASPLLFSSSFEVLGERYEAEDAIIGNCKVLQRHAGYHGSGYANYNAVGSYLLWNIDAPVTGSQEISIRYASKAERPLDLILDGDKEGTVTSSATGAWTNWYTETKVVSLSEGRHTLKLLAADSSGPNIDWISIQALGPSPPNESPITQPTPNEPPPNMETVMYEPKDALAYKVDILQMNSGYQGGGYADYQGFGSYLSWTIEATMTGEHEIVARYAARKSRPADLLVDGLKRETFPFSSSGQWTNWRQETIVLFLEKGSHSLKLLAAESLGPNLDWLSIRPIATAPQAPSQPVRPPSRAPSPRPPTGGGNFPEAVALTSRQHLSRNQFVFSPSGAYKVGLTSGGDLVLKDSDSRSIWRAGISGGYRCYMQSDGNLIVRGSDNKPKWTSHTSNNAGARLTVDDGGRIAVISGRTPLWLDGVPRGEYNGPSSDDLSFPVRGLFYYPWYPATWTVNGKLAHFEPDLGFYSSSDPLVAESHIDAFEYAHVDLSIASWWGPETNNDRARLTLLMDQTRALNSQVKWTIYYEREKMTDPSRAAIKEDLDYLKKWFAWHPTWAHVDGRPVIFVYNGGDCEVNNRWMDAANGEWYVVLKIFQGYAGCRTQPDSWHQYGVANGEMQYDDFSYTIAPGFWRADRDTPRLPRLSESAWRQNVINMVASREPWQLIVSFNEAGEGTMIEASDAWSSDTDYGFYLDSLHDHH